MAHYKVVCGRHTYSLVYLSNLLEYIYEKCDVFEIENCLEKEKYLGTISNEALSHIAIHIAETTLINYGKQDLPDAIRSLELCKIVSKDLFCPERKELLEIGEILSHIALVLLYRDQEKSHVIRTIDYCRFVIFQGLGLDSTFKCSIEAYRTKYQSRIPTIKPDKEVDILKEAYGQFVIDLLKSGKHLFMV